jgi:hypothetical protein
MPLCTLTREISLGRPFAFFCIAAIGDWATSRDRIRIIGVRVDLLSCAMELLEGGGVNG